MMFLEDTHVRTGKELARSALSSSASFPVPSTLTRAPKTLILSVSMAIESYIYENDPSCINRNLTCISDEYFCIFDSFW